jgi:hypothetical protein
MSQSEGSSEAVNELRKFSELIADPGQRKAFASDPDGTLDRVEVNPEAIPENVLGTLKGLSQEELRVLARLNTTLLESGLSTEVRDGASLGVF